MLRKAEEIKQTFSYSKLTVETLDKIWYIRSKLTIKTPERRHRRRSGVFIVNFERSSHIFLLFLSLTLKR